MATKKATVKKVQAKTTSESKTLNGIVSLLIGQLPRGEDWETRVQIRNFKDRGPCLDIRYFFIGTDDDGKHVEIPSRKYGIVIPAAQLNDLAKLITAAKKAVVGIEKPSKKVA